MKSWVCESLTGEDSLVLKNAQLPACGEGQAKVAVECVSLNFPDALIIRGLYQMREEPPFTPGSELAGVVTEVGAGMDVKVGQRVLALTGSGAFSQEVMITPGFHQLFVIPDEMPFEEAAAFNMTYGTGIHALKQRAHLLAGESILILGAAGGCGSAAIEIAKAMGATVIAAVSSTVKAEIAESLGADHVVLYDDGKLRDKVFAVTGNKGVDVVFDPVGGDLFNEAKRCVGWNGRYLVIGFAAGDIPQIGINYTLIKSMSVIGVAYGMSAMKDPAMNQANFDELFHWYREKKLRPHIGHRFSMDELPQALADLYSAKMLGKAVVSMR